MKEEIAEAGERVYDRHIRLTVEPEHSGQIVAIHIPSEDYCLGDSILEATDRLRQKHPDAARGEIYARGVGEPAVMRAHTPRVTRPPS